MSPQPAGAFLVSDALVTAIIQQFDRSQCPCPQSFAMVPSAVASIEVTPKSYAVDVLPARLIAFMLHRFA